MEDWQLPQKQSAAGIVMFAAKSLREMVAVLLVFVGSVLRKDKSSMPMVIGLILIFLFLAIKAFLEYYFFSFQILEGQFVIKKGVFAKKNIAIPLERVQTVQLEQTLFHKIINQYRVLIDTAGSEKTEVAIQALSLHKALALKQALTEDITNTETVAAEENKIQLSTKDLFKLAVSANHLETFGILAAFILARLEDVKDLFNIDTYDWVAERGGQIAFTGKVVGALIFLVLGISMLISIIRIILRYNDFTIQLTAPGFHLKHGLLQSKQQFIGSRKIQFIQWNANWIRRKMGLYMLQVKTVGEEDIKRKQKIQVPITRVEYLQKLSAYYQNELPSSLAASNTIQPQFVTRAVLMKGLPLAVLFTGIAYIWLQWQALWIMLWLVYFIVRNVIYKKNFLFWVNDDAVEISKGVWGRQRILLNWQKIQLVTLQQSIYQRNRQLATLVLHTASGSVMLPYIKLKEARRITDYAAMKVESFKGRWM